MGELAAGLPMGLWVLRLKSPFEPKRFTSPASGALRSATREELCGLLQRAAAGLAVGAPAVVSAVASTASSAVANPPNPGRPGR